MPIASSQPTVSASMEDPPSSAKNLKMMVKSER
jgi:hypothetical protein